MISDLILKYKAKRILKKQIDVGNRIVNQLNFDNINETTIAIKNWFQKNLTVLSNIFKDEKICKNYENNQDLIFLDENITIEETINELKQDVEIDIDYINNILKDIDNYKFKKSKNLILISGFFKNNWVVGIGASLIASLIIYFISYLVFKKDEIENNTIETKKTIETIYQKQIIEIKTKTEQVSLKNETKIIDELVIEKPINLSDLIQGFLISENQKYSQSWDIQSENLSIKWVTKGHLQSEVIYNSYLGNGEIPGRLGFVVLKNKKENLYSVLEERKQPGKWAVLLYGPNAGVSKIVIENIDFIRGRDSYKIENIIQNLNNKCELKEINTDTTYKANIFPEPKTFLLKCPNKQKAIINQYITGGSGGTFYSFEIKL